MLFQEFKKASCKNQMYCKSCWWCWCWFRIWCGQSDKSDKLQEKMQTADSFISLQHTFCAVPKTYANVSNIENNQTKVVLDFIFFCKARYFLPLMVSFMLENSGKWTSCKMAIMYFLDLCFLNGSQRSCSAEILILGSDCFYKALQTEIVPHRKYFHFVILPLLSLFIS